MLIHVMLIGAKFLREQLREEARMNLCVSLFYQALCALKYVEYNVKCLAGYG